MLRTLLFTLLLAVMSTKNGNAQLQAESFPGPDIAAKINAAFASGSGPSATAAAESVLVSTPPGKDYTFTTRLIIPTSWIAPFIKNPILDCQGSTLTYKGADPIGMELLARNQLRSGEIRNCNFVFATPGSHVLMHSSTHFHWHDGSLSFKRSNANPGLDIMNDDSLAFKNNRGEPTGGYFEDNAFTALQMGTLGRNNCVITFRQSPALTGGGSFFYNWFTRIHTDSDAGNSWLCTQTAPPNTPPVVGYGESFDLHANGGGSIFNIGDRTGITRSHVVLTGECNAAPCADVTIHGGGAFNVDSGMSLAAGFNHAFVDGAGVDRIKWSAFDGGIGAAKYDGFTTGVFAFDAGEVGAYDRKANAAVVTDGPQTRVFIPRPLGYCGNDAFATDGKWNGGYFQVVDRPTTDADPLVYQPGAKNLANRFLIRNDCRGAKFGAGWGDNTPPVSEPSTQYGSKDLNAHSLAVVAPTPANSGKTYEYGITSDSSGTLTEYTLDKDLKVDHVGVASGTAFTGTCTFAPGAPITLRVVNGRIVACR